MWFMSKQNKADNRHHEAAPASIHEEQTQKIVCKPRISKLDKGVMECQSCFNDIPLAGHSPLAIGHCPHCGAPQFFPQRIKNYWLYEPLGGGGMGSVYRAMVVGDNAGEVAVKILPREKKTDPYLIEALLGEADVGMRFGQHAHLAAVLDMGYSDGEYFSAMEYIEGVRLDRIIDSPVKPPEKHVVLWALQILSAEQHIFECGYLFRDLKPQNIMIDFNGNARLFDYGLAMSIDEAYEGQSDHIQGSPFYIPPERVVGTGESLCSEIYSLGMVLFHVLASRTYYSADEISDLFRKHVVSLRVNSVAGKLPSDVSPELVRILNKMIQRSPADRYQTYKELASELYVLYKVCA